MPELPEVETIVRQLQSLVIGKTVRQVQIFDSKVADSTLHALTPFQIRSLQRRGKSLLLNIGTYTIVVHLRMTGHFRYYHAKEKIEQHFLTSTFQFHDRSTLAHYDIRRFGMVKVFNPQQLQEYVAKLGPEPLEISAAVFQSLLERKKNAIIKTTLMDQHTIAGIGNIYAQEVLYHAKIDPRRKIHSLRQSEIQKLHQELQALLHRAIINNGTTSDNYSNLDGKGSFQDFLAVYQQERCPKQHFVEKIIQGSRSTFWCGKCQK